MAKSLPTPTKTKRLNIINVDIESRQDSQQIELKQVEPDIAHGTKIGGQNYSNVHNF